MSSIQMLQFLWPALQVWSPVVTVRHRLRAWGRSRNRATAGEREPLLKPFGQALLLSAQTALLAFGRRDELIAVTVEALSEPALEHQAMLLGLVGALVADTLSHSFDSSSTGTIKVLTSRVGNQFQLVVEDSGWMPRSREAWMAHNHASCELARRGGGRLRLEMDWACNRAVAEFPS